MASYVIHKAVSADNFNGIKLTTPSDIKVSHTSTKVSITIPKDTSMHLHTSTQYFNFNYCAFVVVKFKDKDGKTLSTIPDLGSGTELSKMLANSGGAIDDTDYYPSKAAFTEFSSNVLLFHKGQQESDGIQYGNSSPWTSHKLTDDKTITVSIPDKTTSYTIYIAGCTMNTTTYRRYAYDPYYRAKYSSSHPYGESNWEIPAWMNTNMGSGTAYIGGNSCKHSHAFLDKDETGTVIEKDLTSGPLGTDIRNYLKWDNIQQKYIVEKVTNTSLTQDMGTPTVATDNANNTFSAIIRPFKPGKNNPINKIYGMIEFRKDANPIGEFCEVPVGMSFRPQVWDRAYLESAATSGYRMTQNVTIDTPYRCIGVYEAAEVNGKTIYKELTTLYNQNNELTSSDTKIYYRRVTLNSMVKKLNFESHPGTVYSTTHFNIKPWWEDTNKNTASDLTINNWPLTVAPINITTYDNGEKVNKTILAGTSAIWIDLFACATEFDPAGLKKVGNSYYISVYNYENKDFFTGKNYSPEYFHIGYTYKLVDGEMQVQTTLPPYAVPDSVLASATPENPHPSFLADTFETESGNTCSIMKLDATEEYKKTHYYITIRSLMSGDVRKSVWLNTGYVSYPRAPKKLWYESTHNNKIYVSDDYAPHELPDKTYIYKEDLRPRLKDTFTWKWDQAFGDIYTPTEPSHYRVFLYLKSKEPRTGNLISITGPAHDGYYTYLINSTKGLSSISLAKKEVDSEVIGLNIGNIPCYEMQSKYFTLNLKELGFKSGDYCGCRIVSFIDRWSRQIYSDNIDKNSAFYKNLNSEPGNYKITPAGSFTDNVNTVENTDKSLYGTGGYIEDYPNDKSFADGGCPALEGPNGEKIGYDYNQSLTDCEVRNGAIVWVKVSDEPDDWVEGTPWVKTEDGWKEADSLHVKADNSATGWKESD